MTDLLPCPFCGQIPTIAVAGRAEKLHVIECSSDIYDCDANPSISDFDRDTAIAKWNTRFLAQPAGSGGDGGRVLVDRAVVQIAINMLQRDAEQGKQARGEVAELLERGLPFVNGAAEYAALNSIDYAAAPASPQGWLPIAEAPKSVADGSRVAGIYLLGFIPDASLEDDQCKIDVIWWEPLLPNNAGKRGKWCASSFGDSVEVCPTHWQPLPAPPSSGDGRGVGA